MRKLEDIREIFSEQELSDINIIIKDVAEACKYKLIILYGSHARGEQIDESKASQGKKSDYDILVVLSSNLKVVRKRTRIFLKKQFEEVSKTVSCVVESIDTLNHNLRESQYFYSDIINDGILLSKKGNLKLGTPQDLTPLRQLEIAQEDFKMWFRLAEVSFEEYESSYTKFSQEDVYAKRCAFHLQQACENCYKCIELVLTRYCPNEHLLCELKKRVSKLVPEIENIFTIETKEKDESFKHLDYSYIGARYDKDYEVTKEDLIYWEEEARKLMLIADETCQNHIGKLKRDE